MLAFLKLYNIQRKWESTHAEELTLLLSMEHAFGAEFIQSLNAGAKG